MTEVELSERGMKRSEAKPCPVCRRPLCHSRSSNVYRVRIESLLIDRVAVRRAEGLEMMLGNLAEVMGPNEDLAACFCSREVILCFDCAARRSVCSIVEALVEEGVLA